MEEAIKALAAIENDKTLEMIEGFLYMLSDISGNDNTEYDIKASHELISTMWEYLRDYRKETDEKYSIISNALKRQV